MIDRKLLQQALDALDVATTPLARDRQEVLQAQSAIRARLSQCDRCGEVNPAEIHTCTPKPDAVINGIPAYEGPLSKLQRLAQQEQEPVTASEALRHAAQVIQLYDDAFMNESNYMLDSDDCEGILKALAEYYETKPPHSSTHSADSAESFCKPESMDWMKDCADFWNRYTYLNERAQERCEEQAKMWIEKLRDAQPQPEPANEFNPDWDELEACRECLREYMAEIKKLKKEWVGLTTEDKNQIAIEANNKVEMTALEYAQRVGAFTEAKLREKNAND